MYAGTWFHFTTTSNDGLVRGRPCTLLGLVLGTEVASQTISIYDAAAEADIGAGNLVTVIKTDTRGAFTFPPIVLGRGLVVILSGGTVDATVIYS